MLTIWKVLGSLPVWWKISRPFAILCIRQFILPPQTSTIGINLKARNGRYYHRVNITYRFSHTLSCLQYCLKAGHYIGISTYCALAVSVYCRIAILFSNSVFCFCVVLQFCSVLNHHVQSVQYSWQICNKSCLTLSLAEYAQIFVYKLYFKVYSFVLYMNMNCCMISEVLLKVENISVVHFFGDWIAMSSCKMACTTISAYNTVMCLRFAMIMRWQECPAKAHAIVVHNYISDQLFSRLYNYGTGQRVSIGRFPEVILSEDKIFLGQVIVI